MSIRTPTGAPRRFTVEEYHRMIDAGLFDDERVELLEGWVVAKMTKNPPHEVSLKLTDKWLDKLLPAGFHTRPQLAITTADSEPEPDNAVVRGKVRDYGRRHPGPPDIALVVEVSDSTLQKDRKDKGTIYARASIPIYWIINLVDMHVEVYSDPTGLDPQPHYRQRQDYSSQDSVPLVIAGQEIGKIAVRELLP